MTNNFSWVESAQFRTSNGNFPYVDWATAHLIKSGSAVYRESQSGMVADGLTNEKLLEDFSARFGA
jgi:hypothetical protein